jgi:hypothetical protein
MAEQCSIKEQNCENVTTSKATDTKAVLSSSLDDVGSKDVVGGGWLVAAGG